MKQLNLLDQSASFKVDDSGTVIPFNAFENKQPFGITKNDTPTFRIKNEMGFLKSVSANTTEGGYIIQLNTKNLVGLVPGTYQIELVVTDQQTDEELIFPDTGFCSFNITKSALTVTGMQIPTMSLDSFKNELQQYIKNQANSKLQTIEGDFQEYVNDLQNSTIKQAQQALNEANQAIRFANSISLDQIFGGKINGVSVPADFNHIPQGIYSGNGWSATVNTVYKFPSFAKKLFFLLEVYNVQNEYIIQKINLQTGAIYEQVLDASDYSVVVEWKNETFIGNDLTYLAQTGKVTSLDQLTTPGVYEFNAWADKVAGLENLPFNKCWGTLIVFPFGVAQVENALQIAVNDNNVIKFRTMIHGNVSNWNSINVTAD